MQKNDRSQSCNATASTLGREHEENEYKDSDAGSSNRFDASDSDTENYGSSYFEDLERSGRDGDERENPLEITDEDEYEDSDVSSPIDLDDGGSPCFEYSGEAGRNGDEKEYFWAIPDEDDGNYQDLDQYQADCEDQDTDMDSDEEYHQNTNPSEDQHETSHSKPNTESSQESPLYQHNLRSDNPSLPQVPESNPSPTPQPHHETIALGQHHLWMM